MDRCGEVLLCFESSPARFMFSFLNLDACLRCHVGISWSSHSLPCFNHRRCHLTLPFCRSAVLPFFRLSPLASRRYRDDDGHHDDHEQCLSLVICVVVGFVVGLVGVFCVEEDYWPTHEMGSRGEYWGLLTGLVIAIPSGMAVALSTLR